MHLILIGFKFVNLLTKYNELIHRDPSYLLDFIT
jgi:hypothetical protein